ncbi:MAG: hypothetical protein WEB52_15680 [Dehalococcoidia bacterium]
MNSAARKSRGAKAKSWWARRRNRNALWLSLADAGLVGIIAVFVWARSQAWA